MSNVKEELVEASQVCYKTGCYWGYYKALRCDSLFNRISLWFEEDPEVDDLHGEDASWFLLICAEAVDEWF